MTSPANVRLRSRRPTFRRASTDSPNTPDAAPTGSGRYGALIQRVDNATTLNEKARAIHDLGAELAKDGR